MGQLPHNQSTRAARSSPLANGAGWASPRARSDLGLRRSRNPPLREGGGVNERKSGPWALKGLLLWAVPLPPLGRPRSRLLLLICVLARRWRVVVMAGWRAGELAGWRERVVELTS